jgi:hypothetical protein
VTKGPFRLVCIFEHTHTHTHTHYVFSMRRVGGCPCGIRGLTVDGEDGVEGEEKVA